MIRILFLPLLFCVLVTTMQAQSLFPGPPHSFHEPIDTAVLRVVYRMHFILLFGASQIIMSRGLK